MVDHCQLWVISRCLVFIKTTILIVFLQDVDILVETTILSMLCPNNEVAEGMMIYGTMGGWLLGY